MKLFYKSIFAITKYAMFASF